MSTPDTDRARKWFSEQYREAYGVAADVNPQYVDVPFWLAKYAAHETAALRERAEKAEAREKALREQLAEIKRRPFHPGDDPMNDPAGLR